MKRMLERGAGILMPVFSLPSPYGIGTFGKAAYEFVDFLKSAGQKYWQVLPLGPTGLGDSPYQPFSAFAGNPYFIDLDMLRDEGLLEAGEIKEVYGGEAGDAGEGSCRVPYERLFLERLPLLRKAYSRAACNDDRRFWDFCAENSGWLDDFSLFMALKANFGHRDWKQWPEDIRFRREEAVRRYSQELSWDVGLWKFVQYKFYGQWAKLRDYANSRGILIIGDIPLYMALDSADVWAHPELFSLNDKLEQVLVAGVPPDAFSDMGQLWGNPLYRWEMHEETDFNWWRGRMRVMSRLYDVVRIDHFIGLVKYYTIPAGAGDARGGEYKDGPGKKLTDAIEADAGKTKIIAEDLGVSIAKVKELLEETGYPGMKVLEFAFNGDRRNEHLPHMYTPNMVSYGGTHDNETLAGYFDARARGSREMRYFCDYTQLPRNAGTGEIIKKIFTLLYSSVADVVIFQTQDVLGLDNRARINTPGTSGDNWRWRMPPGALNGMHARGLARLADIYGR